MKTNESNTHTHTHTHTCSNINSGWLDLSKDNCFMNWVKAAFIVVTQKVVSNDSPSAVTVKFYHQGVDESSSWDIVFQTRRSADALVAALKKVWKDLFKVELKVKLMKTWRRLVRSDYIDFAADDCWLMKSFSSSLSSLSFFSLLSLSLSIPSGLLIYYAQIHIKVMFFIAHLQYLWHT